jgi:hypothetical protein
MQKNMFAVLIVLWAVVLSCSPVFSAARSVSSVPEGVSVQAKSQLLVIMSDGPTYFCLPGERNWQRIVGGQTIVDGASLRTAAHGYLVLAWGGDNLIMVKPGSGLRVIVQPHSLPDLVLQLHRAEVMVSTRDSGRIEIEGRHGNLLMNHGDASMVTGEAGEFVRSVKGQSGFRLQGSAEPVVIPESCYLEIGADGREKPMAAFDPGSEYESFRRFAGWLKRFDTRHRNHSTEIPFKIDSVKVNGVFISNLPQENGLHLLSTPDGKLPSSILLQMKITPYPAPAHRFELHLGKDLVYAVREGRDGYFEVNFAVPSFPEFQATVHHVDSLDRRQRVFAAGFTFHGRRAMEDAARSFCRAMTDAFSRKDQLWLRNAISKDFHDWQGNTWFDFINMADDTLRRYRDVRLTLHPYRFEKQDGMILVSLNYRLSALTSDWGFRYEDRGTDVYTLKVEDGVLRLYSKVSGMFFNRLKVAVDLRQGILRGRIIDERTRRPLAGVSVTVRGTKYRAETDSMGEYVIYNMPPGRYDIRFYKNGYGEMTATTVTLRPAGEQF